MKKCRFPHNLMAIRNYIYIYIYIHAELVANLSFFVRSAYVPLRLGSGYLHAYLFSKKHTFSYESHDSHDHVGFLDKNDSLLIGRDTK